MIRKATLFDESVRKVRSPFAKDVAVGFFLPEEVEAMPFEENEMAAQTEEASDDASPGTQGGKRPRIT